MSEPTTDAGRALLEAFTTTADSPDFAIRISQESVVRHAVPRIEQEAADRAVTRVLDELGKDIDAMPWEYRGVDLVIRVKEAIEQHRPKGGPG